MFYRVETRLHPREDTEWDALKQREKKNTQKLGCSSTFLNRRVRWKSMASPWWPFHLMRGRASEGSQEEEDHSERVRKEDAGQPGQDQPD